MPREPKVALVTGASGDIGVAICSRLVRAGYDVFAQFHTRADRLASLADFLGERGASILPVGADLRCDDGVRALMRSVAERSSGLDLLVNNAGGARPIALPELTTRAWSECIALNLTAPFLCAREALPLLRANRGLVLNVSSVAAFTGGAFGAHYAAAKAGLVGLTRSLARELGRDGIRVNTIAPGPVDSAMTSSLPPDALASLLAATALGRVVTADEIAEAVHAWATAFPGVTGQTLVIDGGRLFH
jgi:3-oxoacyl-[acyl-carrier protein] reductase